MSFMEQVENLQIPLQDILLATKNFDEENYIGRGGFGRVYRGKFSRSESRNFVAIKRLDRTKGQGEREFMMEIGMLSSYRHENLVSLVGFCDENDEKILVYEYASNGSLDKFLHSKDLTWIQRLKICLDAARGLKYLHHDVGTQHRVIHRDIKSSNILLDENWKAKISDFGLSKIGPANIQFTFLISNACGTLGYVDPQYLKTGILTKESDVFSFGVVLFEVLCGRLACVECNDERRFLFKWAQQHYEKGTLDEIIDPYLRKQMNSASLHTFSTIAYQCVKKRREERPTMILVVEALEDAILDFQEHEDILDQKGKREDAHEEDGSNSEDDEMATESPWKQKVFISFRGEDTRLGFTGILYEAMRRRGIDVYMDDTRLRNGKFIRPELLEEIEASKYVVVVLSSNYASSKWCLDELAIIIRCIQEGKLEVIPVFYYVDPYDVRHQSNTFEKDFAKHEKDGSTSPVQVKTWRNAFRQVGSIAGWHVKGDRYEHEYVKEIVNRITRDFHNMFSRYGAQGLVGIESRAEDVIQRLCLQSGGVRFLVIHGMSGIGKTTLAEFVYHKIRNQFEGSTFVPCIKDVAIGSNDIRELQKKVLQGILDEKNVHVSNEQRRLHGLKFLLVLDDVNQEDQLKCLVGQRHWFGGGSRIIVTTTNQDVLKSKRVEDQKYECELLDHHDALILFREKAFSKSSKVRFEDFTTRILRHLGGHPLDIAVIGSSLHDRKDTHYWKEIEETVELDRNFDIFRRLEVGYHRLDRNAQEIFIYLACFWRPFPLQLDLQLLHRILKDIGLDPLVGIDVLIKNCFISKGYGGYRVHDQLQQMCCEMIRKEFPDEPGRRKVLGSRQDIEKIMVSKKGSEAIQIINDESYNRFSNTLHTVVGDSKCFSKMTRLIILRIHKVGFPNGLSYLPNQLRILEWDRYPLKYFPPTFEPTHLFQLHMHHSQLEKLWKKIVDMPNLTSIDLSGSRNLIEVPDLSMTPNLRTLNLSFCTNLVEVNRSVFVHPNLQEVDLNSCRCLESLGSNKIDMKHLKTLNLSYCSSLEMIPVFGQRTQNLEELSLNGTKLMILPESLWRLKSLKSLSVSKFLKEFPSSISQLQNLMNLDLRGTDFVTLPICIGDICCFIGKLCLDDCKSLISLPKLPKFRNSVYDELDVDIQYSVSEEYSPWSESSAFGNYLHISCLNCPRLVENKSGEDAAVTILKKYLQVGSIFKVIPQASFEIHTARNEILQWFNNRGMRNSVTVKLSSGWYDDTWIGIALCAVVGRNHYNLSSMDACIHASGRELRIPIPFCIYRFQKQIVRYVSVADYLRQATDWSMVDQVHISFDDPKGVVKSCAARMVYKIDLDELTDGRRFIETFERVNKDR